MNDPLRRIKELQRILESSPSNEVLAELLIARSRVEGEQVYLEALQDRLVWNRYPSSLQDQVIQVAQRHLNEEFQYVSTKVYHCQELSHRIASFQHRASGALLNLIPGGSYQMGTMNPELEKSFYEESSPHWSQGSLEREAPKHSESIPALLVGRFPIRQSVWDEIEGADQRMASNPDIPIEGVLWREVQQWLEKAGGGLRLPSEAEWEYACRAGSTTRFFWGEHIDASYCWYELNTGGKPRSVTDHSDKANAFGLVDTSGNIWELCHSPWREHYQESAKEASLDHNSNQDRVLRGGSWRSHIAYCRSANRVRYNHDYRGNNVGFRAFRTLHSKL